MRLLFISDGFLGESIIVYKYHLIKFRSLFNLIYYRFNVLHKQTSYSFLMHKNMSFLYYLLFFFYYFLFHI